MISNRINITKAQRKELIEKLHNASNNKIFFIRRDEMTGKDPYTFFAEVGIDYSDAIKIIKNLSFEEYQYALLDSKNQYTEMFVFNKKINDKIAYIKIGFRSDKTVVISFHEKMYDE